MTYRIFVVELFEVEKLRVRYFAFLVPGSGDTQNELDKISSISHQNMTLFIFLNNPKVRKKYVFDTQ